MLENVKSAVDDDEPELAVEKVCTQLLEAALLFALLLRRRALRALVRSLRIISLLVELLL